MIIIGPVLQMEQNLGLKKLSTSPKVTTGKWQSKEEFLGSLNSEPVLFTINLTAFPAGKLEKHTNSPWAEA